MGGRPATGLVGLGVMGRALGANLAERGFPVIGFDLDEGQRRIFASEGGETVDSLEALVRAVPRSRVLVLMVPAGPPVDAVMQALLPQLDPGDVLIDGGNSFYRDTRRRVEEAARRGVHLVGLGVSGGEEGARHGPSLMAGGAEEALAIVAPMLQAIAARAKGAPCFARVGPEGAGHFVKMIHNGIEYADMQLIAESYFVLRHLCGLSFPAMSATFKRWNQGELGSYLTEITADILHRHDPETRAPMLDIILDAAGQKGTGSWSVTAAMELGVSAPTLAEAVAARALSAQKEERVRASEGRSIPRREEDLVSAAEDALLTARIVAWAQGFAILAAASRQYEWELDLSAVARIWRGGCIIRARLLDRILAALEQDPDLPNLLLDPELSALVTRSEANLRKVVLRAIEAGLPAPALASALSYLDGYRTDRLWADLIQAQRDFFGAHGYVRADRPNLGLQHADWSRLP